MRVSCSRVCARFRQVTLATYSVADSASQITTVMTASKVSCWKRSLMPNNRPTNDRPFRLTTTSTAAPIRSSGATSHSLFNVENTVARITRERCGRAWRHSSRNGGCCDRGSGSAFDDGIQRR